MVRRPGTPARAACLASPPAELTGGDRRARITRREQQHGRGRDQLTPGSRLDGVVLKRGHVCPPLENGRKLSRRLQVGNNTARDFAAASCETSGQQKRNVIHISSTAYEQDHSGAPPSFDSQARTEHGSPRRNTSCTEVRSDPIARFVRRRSGAAVSAALKIVC